MAKTIEQVANSLRRYFLQKDGANTLSHSIFVADGATVNIGTPSNPVANIYATNLVGSGGGGEIALHNLDDPTAHNLSPFQAGYVLRGTGSGTAAIGQLSHAQLSNITENDHHSRIHGILSSDHTVTGAQYSIIGLTNTNTLGLLTSTSDGDTNTNTILRSGATGDLTIRKLKDKDYIAPNPFTTGFQIAESPESSTKYQMNIGRIIADELIVKLFTADETRVRRGSDWLTPSFGIVSRNEYGNIDEYTVPAVNSSVNIWFDDSVHTAGALFENNEWVMVQYMERGTGLTVLEIWGQVSSYYTDGNHEDQQRWTFTNRTSGLPAGITFKPGTMVMGFGTSGSGWIYRTVLNGGPRTKFVTWSGTNPRDGTQTIEVQLGDLSDTTSLFGDLTGENGLFAKDSVYIEGAKLAAAAGDFVVNEDGINIKAGTISTVDLSDYSDKITFTTNPLDPSSGAPVYQIYGLRYDSGSSNYVAHGYLTTQAGGTTGNYASNLTIEASASSTRAYILLSDSGGDPKITLNAVSGSTPKNVEVDANLVMGIGTSSLYPASDSTVNIGRADRYFDTLYVREIYADTYNGSITNIGTLTGDMWSGSGGSDMTINMNSASNRVLEVVNLGAGGVSMEVGGTVTVYGDIVVSGNVDGVDVSSLNSQYLAHSSADINNSHSGNLLWSRLNKTGSNLTDLATRNHSGLQNIGANDHHNQSHVLATNAGLGADHTISGGVYGYPLTATGATTAQFMQLQHSWLSNVQPDDHHNPVTVDTADFVLTVQHLQLQPGFAKTNTTQTWTAAQNFNAQVNLNSLVEINNNVNMDGNLYVDGNVDITGILTFSGSITAQDINVTRYGKFHDSVVIGANDTPAYNLDVRGTTNFSGGNVTLFNKWTISSATGAFQSSDYDIFETDGILMTPEGVIRAKSIGGNNLAIEANTFIHKAVSVSGGKWLHTPKGASSLSADLQIAVDPLPPIIWHQPENAVVSSGNTVYFYCYPYREYSYTEEPPIIFQWQFSTDGGSTWQDTSEGIDDGELIGIGIFTYSVDSGIAGTSNILSFTVGAEHDGNLYRCTLTNANGTTYSEPASLTIGPDNQPENPTLTVSRPVKVPYFDIYITDPSYGQYEQFAVDEYLLVTGDFERRTLGTSNPSVIDAIGLYFRGMEVQDIEVSSKELWFQIIEVLERETNVNYSIYRCIIARENQDLEVGVFPAGTAVAGFGDPDSAGGLGYIEIDASHPALSPRQIIYSFEDYPWDAAPIVILGNLGGLDFTQINEHGLAILDNESGGWIKASQEGVVINNIEILVSETTGESTVRIDAESGIMLNVLGNQFDHEPSRFTIFDLENNAPFMHIQAQYRRDIFGEPYPGARRAQIVANHHTIESSGNIEANLQLLAGNYVWADYPDPINAEINITSESSDGTNFDTQIAMYANRIKFGSSNINVLDLPTSSIGLQRGDLWIDAPNQTIKVKW